MYTVGGARTQSALITIYSYQRKSEKIVVMNIFVDVNKLSSDAGGARAHHSPPQCKEWTDVCAWQQIIRLARLISFVIVCTSRLRSKVRDERDASVNPLTKIRRQRARACTSDSQRAACPMQRSRYRQTILLVRRAKIQALRGVCEDLQQHESHPSRACRPFIWRF